MLTARSAAEPYVEAALARRGEVYHCRGCGAPVVLKAGVQRVAHFAHKPDGSCVFGTGMSLAHLEAQRRIAEALRARGVTAELEAYLPSLAGDRRIDVLAWPTERPAARVAIEVQASDLTCAPIAARTMSYNAEGVAPLWLRLIDFGRFEQVQSLPFRGAIFIGRYRARAWERWAHDHLGGRLWFVDSGTWLAWRGTFVPAHAFREPAAWSEVTQWVELELDGPFPLDELRLNRGALTGPDAGARLGAWFAPWGEPAAAPSGPRVRSQFRRTQVGEERELQVLVDGRWVAASLDGAKRDWRTARVPIVEPLRLG
jgi:hypothetical protein